MLTCWAPSLGTFERLSSDAALILVHGWDRIKNVRGLDPSAWLG